MYTRRELQNAITETERAPANYQNIEKLAHLYTVYDHLYGVEKQSIVSEEMIIGDYGQGDFFEAIRGADAPKIWNVIGELMEAVSVINPRLYESAMKRIREGGA